MGIKEVLILEDLSAKIGEIYDTQSTFSHTFIIEINVQGHPKEAYRFQIGRKSLTGTAGLRVKNKVLM